MFEQAMRRVSAALFPIVSVTAVGADQTGFNPMGSAFFVDGDGTFLTCAHTFNGAPIETFRYLGRLPVPHTPHLPIALLHVDQDRDVAVGRVLGLDTLGTLPFAEAEVGPGASVCICGYSPFLNEDGTMSGTFAPYPQPTFVVVQAHTTGNGVLRRALLLRDNPYFGMSGGPVVNVQGEVVAMQAAVEHAKFNRGGDNREFKVENGIATAAAVLREVLESTRKKPAQGEVA